MEAQTISRDRLNGLAHDMVTLSTTPASSSQIVEKVSSKRNVLSSSARFPRQELHEK